MLSLRRRRALAKTEAPPTDPTFLPDDILILILSHCRIDALLAFRLTNSETRHLIDRYVATIAPCVARSTFPESERLLLPPAGPASLRWLTGLVPRHLAAILVDRHQTAFELMRARYGILAEDPAGDELRARVTNGWYVHYALSKISREVFDAAEPTSSKSKSPIDVVNKIIHGSRLKIETLQAKEDVILHERLKYLVQLPSQLAKDYCLMITMLSAIFNTSTTNIGPEYPSWVFDWGGGIDGQREFRKGDSWLLHFVLHQGPDMFWQQWWNLPASAQTQNHIRDLALKAFEKTPTAVADYQRELTRKFQAAVGVKAEFHTDFSALNPYRYFLDQRRGSQEPQMEKWKETLGHVPFLVKFRCPDELLERHEQLRARDGAAAAGRAEES